MKQFRKGKPFILMALNTMLSNVETEHVYANQTLGLCKQVTGVWNSVSEPSYIVNLPDDCNQRGEMIDLYCTIAYLHDQEAILYVDEYHNAALIYPNQRGNGEHYADSIGKWHSTSGQLAKQHGSYTFNSSTGTYYAVRGV